jgi:D-tyrosyl-tRNA(Tyr) deacylase
MGKKSANWCFGADMKVSLLNDGPVTILIDSKIKSNSLFIVRFILF